MSHPITDVDVFTDPIVVPDGVDDHLQLAEFMETFVQGLANRTRHVKGVADTAVQRDGGNTINDAQDFTGNVEIEGTLTVDDDTTITGDIHHHGTIFLERAAADSALLQTHREPNQSPNPGGNKWDVISQFKNAGGLYVYTYTGQNGDTLGSYIIATNAVWNTGTQQWSLQNSGFDATAIIWRYQDLKFVRKAAGSGSWSSSSWDDGITNASKHNVSHDVNAPKPTDGDQSKGYQYSDPDWRTFMVPLFQACGGQPYANLFGDGKPGIYQPTIVGLGDMVMWPITVPPGCHLGTIRVQHVMESAATLASVGGNDHFVLMSRSGIGSAWTNVDDVTSADGGGVTQETLVNDGGDIVIEENTEYALRWIEPNSGVGRVTHRVQGISVDCWDVGPRNKVN